MLTKKQKILSILWDGSTVSNNMLAQISLRFGGLIHELRQTGIEIDTIDTIESLRSAGYDTKIYNPSKGFVVYRLITPRKNIDYNECKLLKKQQNELF